MREWSWLKDKRYWLGVALLMTLFPAAYLGVYVYLARVQWLIMSGMVFAAMWALPYRYWLWIYLATFVARANQPFFSNLAFPGSFDGKALWDLTNPDPLIYFLSNLIEPVALAPGVLLLRYLRITPASIANEHGMLNLHFAALLSAAISGLKDGIYVLRENKEPDAAYWFLQIFMGHFVGIIVISPIVAIVLVPELRRGLTKILGELLLYLVPLLILLISINLHAESARFITLLRLLMLVGIIIFTVRHDWRGAAVAVFATSFALVLEDMIGPTRSQLSIQTFIAISGAMALLFGTALDQLRLRNHELLRAMGHIEDLSQNIRTATMRNVAAEERHRKQLAADLHDEFGQNLTALQTHLVIARQDATQSIAPRRLMEITGEMRRNISRILEALRPLALDELGLYAALDRGSMRQLCENNGIEYHMEFSGDARLIPSLGDAQQITIFRFVQEAVTNVIRHSHATHCTVRLRVAERNRQLYALAAVLDDGDGRAEQIKIGNGLNGMRDRIVALGGSFHIRNGRSGLCVHMLLPQ